MSDIIERATRHNNLAPHVKERESAKLMEELVDHCRKLEEFAGRLWGQTAFMAHDVAADENYDDDIRENARRICELAEELGLEE